MTRSGRAGRGRPTTPTDAAFELIAADQRNQLLVAEAAGRIVGTLQLTMIPGLSRHGMLRGADRGVRVSSGQRGQGLGRG